jgi:DNA invertase Pin-like site-specific DNA recombinase
MRAPKTAKDKNPRTRGPVAFSYLRFSDPTKQTGGHSLRRQSDARNGWLRAHPKVTLDAGLRLTDHGKSAFRRKDWDSYALARFLELAQEGERVLPGDYLLIENLDRLSREEVVPACHLLTGILLTGVRVVQLLPSELVLTEKSDGFDVMRAVMELSRGHGESVTKSERCGAAWAEKVRCAQKSQDQPPRRKDKRITRWLTDRLPAWVEVRGGELVLRPTRAAAVKRVFNLAAAGLGCRAIATRMDREGVPAFGTAPTVRVTRALRKVYAARAQEYGLEPEAEEFVTGKNGHYTAPCPLHKPGAGPVLTVTRGEDGKPATVVCSAGCNPGAVLGALGLREGELVPRWDHTYISALLSDRRALGEFQLRDGKGKPLGDPLPNYLPAAVTETEWALARAAKEDRPRAERGEGGQFKKGTAPAAGRVDGGRVNLFSGLIRDALGGGTYRVADRPGPHLPGGKRGKNRVLIRSQSVAGYPGEEARSFPMATFEKAILSMLREVDPREVLPRDDTPDEAAALDTKLTGVKAELTLVEDDLDKNGYNPLLSQRARTLEARKGELETALAAARQRAACPASRSWQEFGDLVDVLENAADPEDARLRLRAALRRVVDQIWLLVVPRGRDRLACVQVWFSGGGYRSYLIVYRPPQANKNGRRRGACYVDSIKQPEGFEAGIPLHMWDLRNPNDAEVVEYWFEQFDRARVEWYLAREGKDLSVPAGHLDTASPPAVGQN